MAAPDLDAMSLPQLLELQSAIAKAISRRQFGIRLIRAAIAARERNASAHQSKVDHEPD